MLRNTSSLFKDKATLIIRRMLAEPAKKWTVRELAGASDTSIGLVSRVLSILDRFGFVKKGGIGRGGFARLKKTEGERLLELWTSQYDFSLNKINSYYCIAPNFPKDVAKFLGQKNIHHALTLHSGANLITNYFSYEEYHIYVDVENIDDLVVEAASRFIIKKLAAGGNLHLIQPYYKKSAFTGARNVKGLSVVSNLQLYLDLYSFIPRGKEHALFLRKMVEDDLYG